ncbi:MAG: PIN domain-containing protein [Candidatus Bathyarchaeia archaeon]
MKTGNSQKVFLDTTFLPPFFQIEIEVEAFTSNIFKEALTRFSQIHFSELSIFEAKAKIHTLSMKEASYSKASESFGSNLTTLMDDEKIIFHTYTAQDDEYFNLISAKRLDLDTFDMIIMAQAMNIGLLITEDREILNVRERPEFTDDPTLRRLKVRRWVEQAGRI